MSQLVILLKLHHFFSGLLSYYLFKNFNYNSRQEVDQVMGAFFCVRSGVFAKIGLLDDKYFIWFEEVDFCRRAKQTGLAVLYWSGTQIIHHGGQSFKQQMTLKKQLWFFKSACRYFVKNLDFPK